MSVHAAVPFGPQVLAIDAEAEVQRIARWMLDTVASTMRRRGVVIAVSGGVDSGVCAALAVRAFGRERVFGLLLPERDSSGESATRGRAVCERLGIACELQDIAPTLEAIGCYRQRDEAIRRVFPAFGEGWKCKLAIGGGLQGRVNTFRLIVQAPDGTRQEARLPAREYLQIVAATNHKQRVRKTVEYYHADRLHYAVIGTPNRLEYDQGFFVKNGDGSADCKPIAHLYKTQVYALAQHLNLPPEVATAVPTTDTYSLEQGQDEFYFALPHGPMDLALWARNHGVAPEVLGPAIGLDAQQAAHLLADIDAKRRTTQHLHARPMLVEPVLGVADAGVQP